MQGASILAVGKVYENDMGRSAYSSAAVSSPDAFRDCLKQQSKLISSGDDNNNAGSRPVESKPSKLDRTALLKSPGAKNSKILKTTGNETSNCEAVATDVGEADTAILGCSAVQTGSSGNQDAGTTADQTAVDEAMLQAVQPEKQPAAGSTLPWETVNLPSSQELQANPQQDSAGISVNSAAVDNTLVIKQVATDDQTVQKVDGNALLELQNGQAMDAEEQQAKGNQGIIQAGSMVLSGQMDSSPEATRQTTASDLASPVIDPDFQEKPPQTTTEENGQPLKASPPALDVQAPTPVSAGGTDPENQMEAAPVPTVQVTDLPKDTEVKPAADQAVSAQMPEAATGSAILAEEASVTTVTKTTGSAKAAKGEDKGNGTEAKSESAGAKTSLEVIKAMAGKLEPTDADSVAQADKKDNTNGGELKKLMEFESNRLQAAPLKEPSSEINNSGTADKQAVATVTQAAQPAIFSDVSKNLAASFSDQAPVDVKSLIEQVVQKAELTVKANSSEMKIQLEPEFLGKLTIKIALEDGLLTARFTTDNHQVKHLLESNLSSLRQSLEAQGIKVEKTEVNVQLDSGGTFGGYEEGRQAMWQRPDTNHYQNDSYAAGGYEVTGEEELMEPAFSQTEYYGIQADGSMNFVV